MNKTYRLIWSDIRQNWTVASESAASRGKPSSAAKRIIVGLAAALLAQASHSALAAPPAPNTLPTGGQVVSGQAGIATSGSLMTISQTSSKAIINFNSFSIGAKAAVDVTAPSSSSVTMGRVVGSDPSAIYGRLSSKGQFFLINPNGVLFAPGAHVDVGGLVASTMNISDTDFNNGNYRFTRDGSTASVVNQGEILGKYVAMLAPEVRNEGNIIVARQGTVALAAGEAVTLGITGNNIIDVQVDKASINTLVANKSLVQADDGMVVMSAQSANQLLGQVVNSGQVEADGITADGGVIRLRASSGIANNGTLQADAAANGNGGTISVIADLGNPNSLTTVDGTLSAKGGSQSGNGGFIETSASHLKIADSARIDTTAAHGTRGNWLIDPNDFTVAAGGDITGSALSLALGSNNVLILTIAGAASCPGATCTSGSAGNGDIIFNDAVYWTNGATSLTLAAYRNIVFNQSVIRDVGMFGAPGTAIAMTYGSSGTGAAYTTSTADWVTPFGGGGPVAAGNMFIQDDTYGAPILTPAAILGAHAGNPNDLYLGAKGVNIYVNATSGSSTYDASNVLFAPAFSLAANGTSPIDIIPTLAAGTPTFNTTAKHAATYSGVLYTGGLTSTSYAGLTAGNAGATWTINAATLTATLTNSAAQKTKTYNGTTAAPGGFTPTYSFSGLASGDTAATLSNTGATYDSQHTNATTLTVNGLALTGITGSNGSVTGDYTLAASTVAAAGTINPISITASLSNSGTTKAYDGTNAAPGGFTPTYSFTGSFLSGDTAATLSNTGAAFNGTHVVGTNSIVVSGLSITGITGSNGSMAGDYSLTGTTASASATITPITLTFNPVLGASGTITKVYDGTTAAPSAFTPGYNLTGSFLAGDTAASLAGTAAYNSKDVLSASSIAVTGVHVASITGSNGSQATDYNLSATTASISGATITPANLTLVGTRTTDKTTIAAGSTLTAKGVNGETFSVTGSGDSSNLTSGAAQATPYTLNSLTNLALGSSSNGGVSSNYTALATTGSQYTITSPVDQSKSGNNSGALLGDQYTPGKGIQSKTSVLNALFIALYGKPIPDDRKAYYSSAILAVGGDPTSASALDASYNTNAAVKGIVESVGQTKEAVALYGTDTLAFVDRIYTNLMGRNAKFDELLYWAGEIDAGRLSKTGAAFAIVLGSGLVE